MEFLPGGGGRKAANQIFLKTRADGLTIGAMSEGIIHSAIVGEVGVEYDLNKFNFLGAADRDTHHVLFTHKRLGATGLKELLATEGVRIGAESVGHSSWVAARVFVYFLGLKGVKFTVGYGSPELDQAILAGEVDGRSHNVQSLQQTPELVDQSNFHAIVEWRQGEKNPKFGNLPELETFAKSGNGPAFAVHDAKRKDCGFTFHLPTQHAEGPGQDSGRGHAAGDERSGIPQRLCKTCGCGTNSCDSGGAVKGYQGDPEGC